MPDDAVRYLRVLDRLMSNLKNDDLDGLGLTGDQMVYLIGNLTDAMLADLEGHLTVDPAKRQQIEQFRQEFLRGEHHDRE